MAINCGSTPIIMTLDEFLEEWYADGDTIAVKTSGSTGKPKWLQVEKKRMVASARMTIQFLGLQPRQAALLCMPLEYIAAKMMVVRALVGDLRLICIEPTGHPMAHPAVVDERIDFAAMVPLQVFNSMMVPEEKNRLARVGQLIIGGGYIERQLENQLSDMPCPVWSTYGMTETLSHVAMRRLNGNDKTQWYTPLQGVSVSQDDEGCLVIDAPMLCPQTLHTNDVVRMNADKRRFIVLGRKDNVICSGGVKIQAEEVEKRLQPYVNAPFFIGKEKDPKYGEIVVMVVESEDKKTLEDIIDGVLPKYWKPRKIYSVTRLPLTETGKPMREVNFLK